MPKHFKLLAILFLAFILRLYRFSNPVADWHAFRQADTASVTREYVKHGVHLLEPKYHDLSNIQSGTRVGGKDNTEGWRMVEFPFINAVLAGLLRWFPQLPLVETSRFLSIIASLGTITLLYLFVRKVHSETVAVFSALTYAVLPYSIFYSRVILPEPFMLFFSTGSLFFFLQWLTKERNYWLLFSAIFLSLALLLKPYVMFLGLVYCALILTHPSKFQPLSLTKVAKATALLLLFAVISFTPFIFWRIWIQQYPIGIPASDWLFNGNGIRFRPAWFRWLFWERMTKLFLGYVGVIFVGLSSLPLFVFVKKLHNTFPKIYSSHSGLQFIIRRNSRPASPAGRCEVWLNKPRNEAILSDWRITISNQPSIILLSWWIGILAYFIVFATGNVQHDYYQNLLLPVLAFSVGVGMIELYNLLKKKFSLHISLVLIFLMFMMMEYGSWQQVKGYFNVNHWEYVEAGKFVDQHTPPDAKVIAPANGDTIFLFQTNRTGWPIGFEIEKKISEGAQYYVSTSYDDEARELEAKYQVIEKNEKFILIQLEEK